MFNILILLTLIKVTVSQSEFESGSQHVERRPQGKSLYIYDPANGTYHLVWMDELGARDVSQLTSSTSTTTTTPAPTSPTISSESSTMSVPASEDSQRYTDKPLDRQTLDRQTLDTTNPGHDKPWTRQTPDTTNPGHNRS
jgi:hypothetical protein